MAEVGGRVETGCLPRYNSVGLVDKKILWLGDEEQKEAGQQQWEGQMTSVSD